MISTRIRAASAARIEERHRRVDAGPLELTVTIDDPEMYQKPFVAMKQLLKRGKKFDEQLCIPSEAQRALPGVHGAAGGRHAEARYWVQRLSQ